MSELKSVYIDRTGDWVRSGNDTGEFYLKSEADKVIAHHKYKRCLAMAKMCEERSERYFTWSKKMDFILKWKLRWLELAEEPTWEKFLQLIRKEAK